MIELDEGAARGRHDGQDQRGQTESDQDDAIHGGEDATHFERFFGMRQKFNSMLTSKESFRSTLRN